jgi:hypothetical protein
MDNDNEHIKLENKEPYMVMVVSPNTISDRDHMSPSYLKSLVEDSFCKYEMIDPKDYIMKIATFLQVDNYAYPDVKVHVISESVDYIDEIMYIDVFPEYKIESLKNEFATLLNIDGDIIFGNAIITRTKIPSESLDNPNMWYIDVTSQDIENMLYRRVNTNVITYDSDEDIYCNTTVTGSLDQFAQVFFGEAQYTYKKLELGFLKHNINVWYSEHKYGSLDVFGNILPELCRVDRMIVFTMWCDNYRGNITLDEFNKIKYLSKKLKDYNLPDEYEKESFDHLNRPIIKNKYRILNTIYMNL